jgi:hypothetical protein
MGLLDDAIREHLELKRLHGADAGEVARQEHEALGPVRREDIAVPDPGAMQAVDPVPAAPAEPAMGSVGLPLTAEPVPAAEAVPALEPVLEVSAEPAAPAALATPPPVPAAESSQETVAFSLDDMHAAEARAAASEAATPTPPPAPNAETVAPDVVPADEEHDELEETPEFLQETPEHDRLWFEQKPPRDFDF